MTTKKPTSEHSRERFDHYEVLREVGGLIDSLTESERQQVMASLAERYSLSVAPKTTTTRSYRATPRRKWKYG